MRLFLFFIILLLTTLSCRKEPYFDKLTVDKNLSSNDTIKLLSKYPELKLFSSEVVESQSRTAFIIQNASFFDANHSRRNIPFDNYKCKVFYKNDTLEIWLNNNNGYFGNGVLVQAFGEHFRIKDINPKALNNEVKFIKTNVLHQKLVLNQSHFKKNDSIYGFINYQCQIDSLVHKDFKGYFKTTIQ
ncbi:hypothetical protein [Chryseobacterium gallinarum]|uniref:Uncharacterized protein n=1 Tax=Chryseobacterium gallinarum TaxID=1324352 RepID=A0ABX6KT87_CHRGL|nr:hypothetical protein [Chryseobacterium gallinarum]QIY91707.1 hypothetical protein FOB44_14045 [Chryseobacterium gallinarum]